MRSEKTILEERARIVAQVEDKWKGLKTEGRTSPTEDELAFFEKADVDIKALTDERNALLKANEDASKIEGKLDEYRSMLSEKPIESRSVTQEKAKPNFDATLRKWMQFGGEVLTHDERSVLTGAEKRGTSTLVSSTQNLGGYAMPEEWSSELYKTMLWYGGVLEACGISYNSSGGGDLHLPKVNDTSNTGAIITQGTGDVVLDTTFAELVLSAYTYTSKMIKVSWEMFEDVAFNVNQEVQAIAAERLGRITNTHFTTGDNSGKPNGVATASALGKSAAGASAVTRAEIIDLIHSVDRAYRVGPKVGFMFNDTTLSALKKLTFGTGDDRPLWQPSIREGEPDRLEGYKYWINNDMANMATAQKSILFGDFSKYKIRQVGGYNLARSTERYIDERAVVFFVTARFDADLIDTTAIKHILQA